MSASPANRTVVRRGVHIGGSMPDPATRLRVSFDSGSDG
ncbi:hypothetical protein Snas_6315 [Stackebrandtia nassauensis DSM 44728]|uniref:Uncharacterized protein n=1 Tax=Stackebrandtia nassauensis (strain DSM 44728 / CIP 108903 / NRRL B-16338 / NBRC 102104 / LLR-40K-21) TaxID=446470 RepID=D3Q448_STANL|nr:hypothetical protein Snas_6315 [Stackebrandtia nassauensis DSM 44728]